jgi:uncharacterized membrane protein YccC
MLVVMFSVPFLIVGTLIPRPQFNLATMLVAVNTASFISIQSAYEANFLTFLNSNLAGPAGLLFAFIWTRMTRPFGAELAAARLMRSSWQDVVLSTATPPDGDQRNLAARMLDRLMQLIPRLAATDDHRHPSIESFRDLRVAFNALDLTRARRRTGDDVSASIDTVLDGVRDHYNRCVARRERQPVPASLQTAIDAALARVSTANGGGEPLAEGQPAPDASPPARPLRDALHALVGIRLSLFPQTSGVTGPAQEASA